MKIKKTIIIKEGEALTINETLQTGKEISISTDQPGDKIYVDGKYIGVSPLTTNLSYGSHEIKAEREGKTVSKTINVMQSGGNSSVKLAFKQEINGHEYVDLGLPSGLLWATCNVGANAPEDYGDYFAWGETSPKAKYDWDTYLHWNDIDGDGWCDNGEATINSDISGNAQYDAATANWGGSWRMPTKDEMQELVVHCEWEYTQVNGVNGAKVIGPNGSCIFLPAAGGRDGSSLIAAGDYGYYWCSTPYGIGNDDRAWGLDFDNGSGYVDWGYYRGNGLPVRPITE